MMINSEILKKRMREYVGRWKAIVPDDVIQLMIDLVEIEESKEQLNQFLSIEKELSK